MGVRDTGRERQKHLIEIPIFGGLQEHLLLNENPKNILRNVQNGFIDSEGRILRTREAAQHYDHTENEVFKNMFRISLPKFGATGEAIFCEILNTATNKVFFRITQDPTAAYSDANWPKVIDSDNNVVELNFYQYPCKYLTYRGKLWITNGGDKVWLYDGTFADPLSDELFVRGRYICEFKHRIWLANTPEGSYRLVTHSFHDDEGHPIFPDMADAWSRDYITPIPEAKEIVGICPLTEEILAILGSGGIFTAQAGETVLANLTKISDIECQEGDYLVPNAPVMAFDKKRKAYWFMGNQFKEIRAIQDTIKAQGITCAFELYYDTQREWDRGGQVYTAADFIKNAITFEPRVGITGNPDADYIIGEKQENIGGAFAIKKTKWIGQSFTCEAWEDGGNIPKYLKAIEINLTKEGTDAVTVKVQITKYDALPDKIGASAITPRQILAEWDVTWKDPWEQGWKEIRSNPAKKECKLIPGETYFIEVKKIAGDNYIKWHHSKYPAGDVYVYGMAWTPKPIPSDSDLTFRIKYVPIKIASPELDYEYNSDVFYRPGAIGQLLSMFCDRAKTKGNYVGNARLYYRTNTTSDMSLVPWILAQRNDEDPYLPTNDGFFQFKLVLDRGWLKLTFEPAGYTGCVTNDIGLPVVGETTGGSGILMKYDNETREWWVKPDNPNAGGDEFDVAEIITITGGTGTGTTTGAADTNNMAVNKYTTPIVYAVKMSMRLGDRKTFNVVATQNRLFLHLDDQTLVWTRRGWFRFETTLGLKKIIEWGFSGTGMWAWAGDKKWAYLSLAKTDSPAADILLDIATGPICIEELEGVDLIFRKLFILHETFYPKPIEFDLDCWTDENSFSYDASAFDPGTPGIVRELRLLEFSFPQPLAGKNLIFNRIRQKKEWVQGIKAIKVLVEIRHRGGIPQPQ